MPCFPVKFTTVFSSVPQIDPCTRPLDSNDLCIDKLFLTRGGVLFNNDELFVIGSNVNQIQSEMKSLLINKDPTLCQKGSSVHKSIEANETS